MKNYSCQTCGNSKPAVGYRKIGAKRTLFLCDECYKWLKEDHWDWHQI